MKGWFYSMKNKFFQTSDLSTDNFFYTIPDHWWSRKYEYPFAFKFAKGGVVLDAACGVAHPLKFELLKAADEVYACDLDDLSKQNIIDSLKYDVEVVLEDYSFIDQINFAQCGIEDMPYESNKFDTIFCISVIEHLPEDIIIKSLKEFYRTLKPGGTLVITADYPSVAPMLLLGMARAVGFSIDEYDYLIPQNLLYHPGWRLGCFSMVLNKE